MQSDVVGEGPLTTAVLEDVSGHGVVASPRKLLLDVREVADTLGCSRTFVYQLITARELRCIKLGRLTRVHVDVLHDFVSRKCQESAEDAW